MTEMGKFRFEQFIKDRYATMFNNRPELAVCEESLEKTVPRLMKIAYNFGDLRKEKGDSAAVDYLFDTIGYLDMLCSEALKQNDRLVEALKKYQDDDMN